MPEGTCSEPGCHGPVKARGLCNMHYVRGQRLGVWKTQPVSPMTLADKVATVERRFWAKVNKNGPIPNRFPNLGRCWVWTGSADKHGYGQMWSVTRVKKASRISYELHYGSFDESLDMCHRCDYPPCVRPTHLFTGTRMENQRDMVNKGRDRNGNTCGEAVGTAILTNVQVREIKRRLAKGIRGSELAREFGVSQAIISRIKLGRAWRNIPDH